MSLSAAEFSLDIFLSSLDGGCMALNIKDAETDRLARQLAEEAGESITVAARRAIEERLVRIRAQAGAEARGRDLMEFITRARARPVLDDRSPEEIIGYDEDGLPV